jgi:hypothetical protein
MASIAIFIMLVIAVEKRGLEIFSFDNFFTFIGAARWTGTVGKLGSFALGTRGNRRRGQKIMSSPHIFSRF